MAKKYVKATWLATIEQIGYVNIVTKTYGLK